MALKFFNNYYNKYFPTSKYFQAMREEIREKKSLMQGNKVLIFLTKKYNEAISFYVYLEQIIENLKDENNPIEDRVYLLYEYQEALKEADNYIEFIKNELDETDIDERKVELPTKRPKEDIKENQLMTVTELKAYLKCSKASIYRKTSRKEIPHNKIANTLYFDKKEIDEWIKSHKRKTIEEIDMEAERYSLRRKRQ